MTATETNDSGKQASVPQRLHHAIGPIAGAMILDAADLVTFGPFGIYTGFLVGAAVAFWLTSLYRFSVPMRLFWSFCAGIYCTIPHTELVPIATVMSAVHRFFHWSSE